MKKTLPLLFLLLAARALAGEAVKPEIPGQTKLIVETVNGKKVGKLQTWIKGPDGRPEAMGEPSTMFEEGSTENPFPSVPIKTSRKMVDLDYCKTRNAPKIMQLRVYYFGNDYAKSGALGYVCSNNPDREKGVMVFAWWGHDAEDFDKLTPDASWDRLGVLYPKKK